jgi:hypothetical protein
MLLVKEIFILDEDLNLKHYSGILFISFQRSSGVGYVAQHRTAGNEPFSSLPSFYERYCRHRRHRRRRRRRFFGFLDLRLICFLLFFLFF